MTKLTPEQQSLVAKAVDAAEDRKRQSTFEKITPELERIERERFGVSVAISIEARLGHEHFDIPLTDLPKFVADPDAYIAAAFEATIGDLRLFMCALQEQAHGDLSPPCPPYSVRVECAAITSKGKRCKAYVIPREDFTTPTEYADAVRRGGYCSVHAA